MHRLIIFRHGEAERHSESGEDFDRRLVKRGRRESAAMGETLADLGLVPDLALVSPSARTRETWAAIEANFPRAQVRYDDRLYHAEAEVVRRLVEEADKDAGVIMVVGHNPGLHELVVRLLTEAAAPANLLARAQRGLPTGAAAVFLIDGAGRPAYDGLFLPK